MNDIIQAAWLQAHPDLAILADAEIRRAEAAAAPGCKKVTCSDRDTILRKFRVIAQQREAVARANAKA